MSVFLLLGGVRHEPAGDQHRDILRGSHDLPQFHPHPRHLASSGQAESIEPFIEGQAFLQFHPHPRHLASSGQAEKKPESTERFI
jgi:hypothetical protein